ncbi:hypothetical protein ACA910_002249 [Epithemia clementina (nom. ined.)]
MADPFHELFICMKYFYSWSVLRSFKGSIFLGPDAHSHHHGFLLIFLALRVHREKGSTQEDMLVRMRQQKEEESSDQRERSETAVKVTMLTRRRRVCFLFRGNALVSLQTILAFGWMLQLQHNGYVKKMENPIGKGKSKQASKQTNKRVSLKRKTPAILYVRQVNAVAAPRCITHQDAFKHIWLSVTQASALFRSPYSHSSWTRAYIPTNVKCTFMNRSPLPLVGKGGLKVCSSEIVPNNEKYEEM